jgi:D-threo-aldose 1-dehydrogenase
MTSLSRLGQTRQAGASALRLPAFGFGTAPLGEHAAKIEESVARSTLDAAWDAGIRFFDTAPWYGRGLAEHRLGAFLRNKPRDEFLITTKVGRTLRRPADPSHFDRSPWVGGLNFEVVFDYTYDGVMRSYEQALQRLSLDRVDALVIHDLDLAEFEAQLTGSGIKALEELKRRGDIMAYGMGINEDESLDTTATLVDLDFCLVALPYTLLDQNTLETGMAALQKRGVSVIVGSPFASGILATGSAGPGRYKYAPPPPDIIDKVRRIEAVCRSHAVPLPAAALQFVLAHPSVISTIPGGVWPDEVRQNVANIELAIPAAFWSDLKTAGLVAPAAPVPGD